ncbi:MAG: GAF domain-containing protein [Gemmatimonadetes bacterium]|nr:GAF domain-containing protein [Gemmatimonadota bacterium]MBK8646632.1 GAF domain-containing protein [Gemmatimonadota bacterium]
MPQPAALTLDQTASDPSALEVTRLRERVDELTRERDQLLVVIDLQQELGGALQVAEVLQRLARRLGELFGLDRASIYLGGEGKHQVRLVATYEDPTISNVVVDLARYPELADAFSSGETIVIPDAVADPRFAAMRDALDLRSVRSIIVVPMRSRGGVIGAIVLRTERGGVPFSTSDIQFCEVIAGLTARALRNAHRFEQVQRANDAEAERRRRVDLERIAFVAFLRRLVSRYTRSDDQKWAETLLPRESDDELERLVSVAMQVIEEEAKG